MNLQALRESGKATLGQVSFDLDGDGDKKNMIKMSTIVHNCDYCLFRCRSWRWTARPVFRLARLQGKNDNLCSLQDDDDHHIHCHNIIDQVLWQAHNHNITITISQCHNIIDDRYCGKQSGFYPRDDDWAAAKIDEIIDTATDITVVFYFNDDHDDLVDDADDAFNVRSPPLILNNYQNNYFD